VNEEEVSIAELQEQAATAVDKFNAQEQKAVAQAISLVSDNLTELIIMSVRKGVVAVIPTVLNSSMLSIPLQADESGFVAEVSISASSLQSISNAEPLVLSAGRVHEDVEAALDTVLSQGQKSNSSTPTLAAKPISISLFYGNGSKLEHVELEEPLVFTLMDSAPDNVTCAFWDEALQQWNTDGVKRIAASGDANNSSRQPLVCSTLHLSIFGAIAGAFGDIAQVLVCSNIAALFQPDMIANIVLDTAWALEDAGIALWCVLGLATVTTLLAVVKDHQQAAHDAKVVQQNQSHSIDLRAAFRRACAEQKARRRAFQEEAMEAAAKKKKEQTTKARIAVGCRVLCIILKSMKDAIIKLIVKTLRLPNSVHSLLLGLPDAGEKLSKLSVRRMNAASLGVSADSVDKAREIAEKEEVDTGSSEMMEQLRANDARFRAMPACGKICILACSFHPWVAILEYSSYVSHTARVVLTWVEIIGSVTMGALFYQTVGGALSRKMPPAEECIPRPGLLTELIQAFTVAIVTCAMADFFVAFLSMLRFVDFDEIDAMPPLEQYEALEWLKVRTRVFWILCIIYLILCVFCCISFLANVTQKDAMDWLVMTAMVLLEDFILIPLGLGLLLATVAALMSIPCIARKAEKLEHMASNLSEASARISQQVSGNLEEEEGENHEDGEGESELHAYKVLYRSETRFMMRFTFEYGVHASLADALKENLKQKLEKQIKESVDVKVEVHTSSVVAKFAGALEVIKLVKSVSLEDLEFMGCKPEVMPAETVTLFHHEDDVILELEL